MTAITWDFVLLFLFIFFFFIPTWAKSAIFPMMCTRNGSSLYKIDPVLILAFKHFWFPLLHCAFSRMQKAWTCPLIWCSNAKFFTDQEDVTNSMLIQTMHLLNQTLLAIPFTQAKISGLQPINAMKLEYAWPGNFASRNRHVTCNFFFLLTKGHKQLKCPGLIRPNMPALWHAWRLDDNLAWALN